MTAPQPDSLGLIETRFGAFAAPARDVIHFAGGLPGFEGCARYVLLNAPELSPFNCLQGLEGSKPSFLVVDPSLVQLKYATGLNDAEYRRLQAEARDSLAWFAIVRVGPDEQATVNLRAPIVINPHRMLGIQALPHDSAYRHDHPLRLEPSCAGLHA
jgi:flagellar assembly factor FliW